jgi:signal transduction histidine kinase
MIHSFCRTLLFLLTSLLLLAFGAVAQTTAAHLNFAQFAQSPGGSFDAPPAQLELPPTLVWQSVSMPHVSHWQGTAVHTVTTAWYRFDLSPAQRAQWDMRSAQQIHFYLVRWRGVAQIAVYGDSGLLFNSRGSEVWNGFNHPLWLALAPTQGATVPQSITIRLSHASTGGAVSSAWVGPADEIMWRWRLRSWLQTDVPYFTSYAFLGLGFFAAFVWVVRRREPVYAYFAASAMMYWVRCLHYHWGEYPIAIDENWFGWATLMSVGWLVVLGHHMAYPLHRQRIAPWVVQAGTGMMVIASLIMLPPLQAYVPAHLSVSVAYLFIILSGICVVSVTLAAAWRGQSRHAKWLSVSSAGQVILGMHDLALMNWRINIEMPFLLPYGMIGLFLIYLAVAWQRYVQALQESENAQAALATRLQAREQELALSYEKLSAIERQRTLHEERQRLMQDMHDGLGSSLVSALRMVEHGQMNDDDVTQVLKECIDDLKLTIDSLEPVDTDVLLLLAAFRFRIAPRLEKAGLKLQWDAQAVPPLAWLSPRHSLHILRIVQEVFTNIIKHASAQRITLSTEHDATHVRIHIRDNGKQAVSLENTSAGRGVANVRRRAHAIGAQVQWQAVPAGMCFTLLLPIQAS